LLRCPGVTEQSRHGGRELVVIGLAASVYVLGVVLMIAAGIAEWFIGSRRPAGPWRTWPAPDRRDDEGAGAKV
jgi:hypothetical protein